MLVRAQAWDAYCAKAAVLSFCSEKFKPLQKSIAGFCKSSRRLLGAAAFCLVLAQSGRAFGSNSVPDWVRDAAHKPLPEVSSNTKAVLLLNEMTYTVGQNGQAVEHVRRVVKILRPQGREYGYPFVTYDKDSKVLSMHVWSIDPAGHEYAMKDNEIREFGRPGDWELYSDDKAKVADPPGRDPGGVVAYEYERRERPYLAETNWIFQDELPRVTQSFTLVLPQGYTYTTTWAHHEKIDGADLENHHYRWDIDNVPAIDLEHVPMSPSVEALAARMTVHYAGPGLAVPQEGTWKGIGEWYATLSGDRIVATPDISAKAAELTKGKTDFYSKAEAIGEFVQKEIRYVAIEIGVGGNQPHAAADIFHGRYGDCKDKATLLSAMLSSVGIHSALVMVDTERGVVDPDAPSILGNHMIAAIEVPPGYESPQLRSLVTAKTGKRYLIFDPTWDKTPFGQLENTLQGSYGVLVEGPNSQIIPLPVLNPELNTMRRTASFKLGTDGTLTGSVIEKQFGDLSEYRRTVFTRDTVKQQQEYMDGLAARDFPAVALSSLKVDNVDSLNKDLTTSFDISATHYASNVGPLLMIRPRVLGTISLSVDHKSRKVAIDLEQTMLSSDEFDIELPPGYVVDELPDPVKVDYGFASYQSSTEVHGQVLHYKRTYTVRQVTIPAEKYTDLQRLAGIIANDEQGRAVLKLSH